jgi:hypothetical protein
LLDLSQLAVNLTGVVLLALTIWSLRSASRNFRRQMNAQVYLAYNERYKTLMTDCLLDFRITLLDLTLPEVDSKDRDKIKLCMLRYLNLCSEEFHLKEDEYLSREVWRLWQNEMVSTLRKPLYISGWSEFRAQFESYTPFLRYVDRVQGSGGA